MIKPALLISVLSLTATTAQAALIIDDQFDDGNLGTNATGTGTGFDSVGQNPFTEGGGFASSAPGGSATTVLTSKESFDAFQAGVTTRSTWNINNAHLGQSSYRTWVGLRVASSSSDHFLPGTQGIYVSIFSSDIVSGAYEGHLLTTNNGGGSTTLATWNWDAFNPGIGADTGLLDIILDTTDSSYGLSFSQGVSLQTGSLSGALIGIGTLGANFEVGAHNQWSGNTIAIDSITVETLEDSAVPSPASALLILGMLPLLRRRTR